MKTLLFIIVVLLPELSNAQTLSIDQSGTGFYPSYCRLFGYQNGGGIVYASATGGTPPYSYQWTNLGNAQTSTNSTWGGLQPGDYEIKIWDSVNDSVSQVIVLDSLNPIADFMVVSSGLTQMGSSYVGTAPVSVDYVNQSSNSVDPNDPGSDTTYFWKMTQFQSPYLEQTNATQSYTYNYGGDWYVQLEVVNHNGCSDVLTKHLDLNGPASTIEDTKFQPNVFFKPNSHEVILTVEDITNISGIKLYDFAGREVATATLHKGLNKIKISHGESNLVYTLSDPQGEVLFKGKPTIITD